MELNVWQIVVIAMFTATIIQGIYIYLQREAHMGLYVLVFLMTGFVLGVISTPTGSNVPTPPTTHISTGVVSITETGITQSPEKTKEPVVVVQEESTGSIVDKESAVCKILPELYKEFLATSPSGEQEENIFYNTLTRSLNGINDTTPSGGTIYGYEDWYTDPSYGQYDSGRESATTEENSNPDIMSLYKISAGDKQCDMVFVVKGQAPKLSKKNYTYIPVLYTKYHALQKLQEYLTEMIKDRKSYQENLVKSKQKLQSIGIDTN